MLDAEQLATEAAHYMKCAVPDADHRLCAAAVAALIDSFPQVPRTPEGEYTAAVKHAAIMYVARLHRRRNSPTGIEQVTDIGSSYVARYDPDIARALRIDSYTPPRIG